MRRIICVDGVVIQTLNQIEPSPGIPEVVRDLCYTATRCRSRHLFLYFRTMQQFSRLATFSSFDYGEDPSRKAKTVDNKEMGLRRTSTYNTCIVRVNRDPHE